jgi:CHAT domain-containing protein
MSGTPWLTILQQIGEKEQQAFACIHIGNTRYELQQYDEALKAYEDALRAFEELGHSSGKAYALKGMGNVYRALGRLDVSLSHHEKALTIRQEMGDLAEEASLHLEIGDTYRLLGRHADALKEYEVARRIAEGVRRMDGVATAWLLKGVVYQAQHQWDLAVDAYKQAIGFVEKARIQIGDPWLASGFFGRYKDAYRNLVYCRLRLAQQANTIQTEDVHDALLIAEQGRARMLADIAFGGGLDIESKLSLEEKERLKQLQDSLTFASKRLYTLLTREAGATVLKELKAKVDQARREYEDFRRALYARYAEMPIVSAEAAIVRVKDIPRLLRGQQTAFVEYVVGEDFLVVFTVERQSVGSRDIRVSYYVRPVKRDDLARMVRSYRERIQNRALSLPEARQLYDLLIAPIAQSLENKRVVGIVPDDILWEVPFHALVDPQGKHLVQRWTVFYVPSLTVLNRLHQVKEYRQKEFRTRPQNASRKLLALAYPAFGTAHQIENPLRGRFSELPSTEREAKAIGAIFGKDAVIYMREEATEERAKRDSPRYRFLHFATHALLDTASPMSSGLLLAQVPEQQEDGYLEAREIAQLSLDAEMVVLSACETARGRIQAGEGIIGLCWALFLAGSPTNVLSQWKVDDESTQMLMTEFYRHMLPARNQRVQPSKAEALRQAQLKLLKDKRYQHPFYWAPFVLIGDWR